MADNKKALLHNADMAEHANGAAQHLGASLDFSLLYIIQGDKGELKDRNSVFLQNKIKADLSTCIVLLGANTLWTSLTKIKW